MRAGAAWLHTITPRLALEQENDLFLKDLKFGIGDGHLQYYLYNWKCQEMDAPDVGLVLL